VDDGRGDVSGLGADIGLLARHSTEFGLLLGGTDTGLRLPVESAVSTVLAAATAFLAERTTQSSEAWRIAELPGGPASVAAHLPGTRVQPIGIPVPTPPPIGTLPGGVSVSVPLGRLTPAHASAVAANAPAGFLRVTPWRGIVLPGATDPAPLAAAGLITDPTSPWHGVTACAGKPRCAKALADVRADAASLIRGSGGVPVHWSGCSRRCGRPRGDIVDVLATGTGYEVARAGTTRIQSREQTAAAVAEARGAL
jgi:precorrin-3B synthase